MEEDADFPKFWNYIVDAVCEDTLRDGVLSKLHPGAIDRQDANGDTLLHFAANCTASDSVKILIEAGARVDTVNAAGHTALAVAAMNCRDTSPWIMSAVHQLLRASKRDPAFDIDKPDLTGNTILTLVLQKKGTNYGQCGYHTVIPLLLRNGAKWGSVKWPKEEKDPIKREYHPGILEMIRRGVKNEQCKAAVLCMLCIRHYCKDSVVSLVPRDIIKVIAEMVLKTAPPVWFPKYK